MRFADVILPLPIAGHYTYFVPEEWREVVVPGCRVIVHFGKKKFYTAIIIALHDVKPEGYDVKLIYEVLDHEPIVLPHQLKLWKWIADYYLCTIGEVYKAALPTSLKPESETVLCYNDDWEAGNIQLSVSDRILLDYLLQEKEVNIYKLEKQFQGTKVLGGIKKLLELNAVSIKEEVQGGYKPKTVCMVRFTSAFATDVSVQQCMDDLGRAPKQQALLMAFIQLSQWSEEIAFTFPGVPKKELIESANVSPAILQSMLAKGIFEQYTVEVEPKEEIEVSDSRLRPLSEVQEKAFRQIEQVFTEKDICLLHGVTSSGKTEIYIHLIEKYLKQGKQVLYLLPEIALTTQITHRLREVFGDRLGIYHSKYPDTQRVEVWKRQLSSAPYDVIIGVRSSIFLPFRNLGLVIVDEEHENTYKQQDPAPRYHARSVSMVLAKDLGACVLLGTATPSIESYYHTQNGKYGLVSLLERHGNVALPEIIPVDTKELLRKKIMKGIFSPLLVKYMQDALEQGQQIILFQNRRGFAPIITCHLCAWTPRCEHCDVSLTYHKSLHQLVCHYCGSVYPVPDICPSCGNTELQHRGYGTERVEEAIETVFPNAKVARMDLDTTRSRTAHERIIADFQNKKTDILIGTQMISKGLDFDNVSVVGILDADGMMSYPDFRSHERAFQLMSQVSGRAGRRDQQGVVILQTKSVEHSLIHQVLKHDFFSMYQNQIEERSSFFYPPFCKLIYVYVKHKKEWVVEQAAASLAIYLRQGLQDRVLGPDKPVVGRIQTFHIRKFVIKIENTLPLARVKEFLMSVQEQIQTDSHFKSILMYYDVDPM